MRVDFYTGMRCGSFKFAVSPGLKLKRPVPYGIAAQRPEPTRPAAHSRERVHRRSLRLSRSGLVAAGRPRVATSARGCPPYTMSVTPDTGPSETRVRAMQPADAPAVARLWRAGLSQTTASMSYRSGAELMGPDVARKLAGSSTRVEKAS